MAAYTPDGVDDHLVDEVYLEQPQGFVVPGHGYSRVDRYLRSQGLHRSSADPNVYFCIDTRGTVILILYVDDLKLIGSGMHLINELKRMLNSEFRMTDLGVITTFLGVQDTRTTQGLLLLQTSYAL